MIPIIPMPVFPYQDRDPLFGADLRASDADRDVAADILCAAVADGRLTLAELEERLEEVLSARTLREIARRISDIPGPRLSRPVRPAVHPAATPEPAAPPEPAATPGLAATPEPGKQAGLPSVRPRPGTRWSLLQSLLATPGEPSRLRALPPEPVGAPPLGRGH
jgi:hypothetical protein